MRTDFHWLQVSKHDDLLYFGGGATKQDFFGYGGNAAGGAASDRLRCGDERELVPIPELAAYYGHTFGGSVPDSAFPGRDDIDCGYVETTLTF